MTGSLARHPISARTNLGYRRSCTVPAPHRLRARPSTSVYRSDDFRSAQATPSGVPRKNVVPARADELTAIRPRCADTMARAMNKPRPMLLDEPSAAPRVSGSKTTAMTSGGIGAPPLCTEKVTESPHVIQYSCAGACEAGPQAAASPPQRTSDDGTANLPTVSGAPSGSPPWAPAGGGESPEKRTATISMLSFPSRWCARCGAGRIP